MASFTNAVNLRLVDGGEQVKQGDTASLFVYELLDEHMKAIELDGQEAVLRLVGRKGGAWSRTLQVEASKVSFTIDEVLPLDTYTVEIVAGGYVFPSDHKTKIKVVKSEVDYATSEVVSLQKLDIEEEVKKQLDEATGTQLVSKQELAEKGYLTETDVGQLLPAPYDETALAQRVQALESKPEPDLSAYATKEELKAVRGSQPSVDNSSKEGESPQAHLLYGAENLIKPGSFRENDIDNSKGFLFSIYRIPKNKASLIIKFKKPINLFGIGLYNAKSRIYIGTAVNATPEPKYINAYPSESAFDIEGGYCKLTLDPIGMGRWADKELKILIISPDLAIFGLEALDLIESIAIIEEGSSGGSAGAQVMQKLILVGNQLSLTGTTDFVTLPEPVNVPKEIRGTGMPNGRVTANVGASYIDLANTNGALKWIKMSGIGNTGWEVVVGDTGWRYLNSESLTGLCGLEVRRINRQVFIRLQRENEDSAGIGGVHTSDLNPQHYAVVVPNMPSGFRAPEVVTGKIYDVQERELGTWFLEGAYFGNSLRFQFLEPLSTIEGTKTICMSSGAYLAEDDWPVTLP